MNLQTPGVNDVTTLPLIAHTHYVPAFAITVRSSIGPTTQRAICGRCVDPRHSHSLKPTCPDCAELIASEERVAS